MFALPNDITKEQIKNVILTLIVIKHPLSATMLHSI